MEIKSGIAARDRKAVADGLAHLLADSYTLYLKTHNFHWNVTGHMFQPLHTMFEEHYTELATAVDEIAERIRALGEPAPGSYRAFAELSSIADAEGVPAATDMVKELLAGHEAVAATARKVIPTAQTADDEVTVGLLIDRLTVHEKTAWMLRSLVD